MESLDNSVDKAIIALTDTFKILKESLKTVDKRTLKYEDVQKEVASTQKEQKSHATLLKDVRHTVDIITQKELESLDTLEKDVSELKSHLTNLESEITKVKDRLNKVGETVQRHVELKRSLRP